jgi:hypothetical protein
MNQENDSWESYDASARHFAIFATLAIGISGKLRPFNVGRFTTVELPTHPAGYCCQTFPQS